MMRRELKGYDVADYIEVPSTHVAESFAPWPGHARKLFVNPYGVDLDQFPLRSGTLPAEPTVLFRRTLVISEGRDVLAEAIEGMDGVRLIHVGALLDAPFPSHSRFIHHDPVPQWKLKNFYGAAHVFALASREEGLAMVQVKLSPADFHSYAPISTGGSRLGSSRNLPGLIHVVPAGDLVRCVLRSPKLSTTRWERLAQRRSPRQSVRR